MHLICRVGRDMKCSGILDVCCNESMILEKPQEKDKIIDKMIWEMYSTPKPPTMPSDTCKCVPYYLCGNGTIVTSGRGLIDERYVCLISYNYNFIFIGLELHRIF